MRIFVYPPWVAFSASIFLTSVAQAAPGDKADLARQTRLLMDDPPRRSAFGVAGRRRAQQHFTVGQLIENAVRLYEGGIPS